MQTVKAAVRKKENDPPTIDFYPVDEIKVIKAKSAKSTRKNRWIRVWMTDRGIYEREHQ